MPKISVLLPVKNGEKYIAESLESILSQTFNDFEILIFDDASTDCTIKIIENFQDPRIKLFIEKEGFISNLNQGIELSDSPYIARMDADDIMNPVRLAVQLLRMETLNIDLCASWLMAFGEDLDPCVIYHTNSGILKDPLKRLIKGNIIAHPSVMLKKEFLIKNNLRYQNYPYAEDYKLWFEIAKRNGVFFVEPRTLLSYRVSKDQATIIHQKQMKEQTERIKQEIYLYLEGNNVG